ncbi:MAG TPA: T9SS type A sorting domain-containing protein [Bacteroidota bacterium]|nr:T9SS type A sorting domain-containing protein [Bacteroidota bacterium]
MKLIKFTILLLLVVASVSNAQMWTTMNGPVHASTVQDLTIGKGGSQKLYAITDSAATYSSDGTSWSATGEAKTLMTVGACKPSDQDLVVVAKAAVVYQSTNGGTSFSTALSSSAMVPNRIRFSAANSANAYLCADRVSPNNTQSSLWSSTNSGSSWSEITYFKSSVNVDINDITFKPSDANKLWVCVNYNGSTGGGEGVYYYDGSSWGIWIANSGLGTNPTVYSIAYKTDASTPQLVAAVKYGTASTKIYTVNETGSIWVFQQTLTDVVRSLNVNRPSGRDSLVIASGGGVYVSVNGGGTWTLKNGSGGTALTDLDCRMAVCDRSNSSYIYVATPSGVFKSTDFGTSWNRYSPYLISDPSSSVGARSSVLFSVAQSISIVGKYNGSSWDAGTTLGSGNFSGYYSIVRPQDGNYVQVCGTEGTTSTDAVIYNTTNAGTTWTKERDISVTGNAIFHQMAADPNSSSQRVYAVGKTGSSSTSKNFWWSTNKGATWSSTNGSTIRGSGGADTAVCLAIDASSLNPTDADVIYTGLRQQGGYKSIDKGSTWNSMTDIGTGKTVNAISLNSSTTTLAHTLWAGLNQGLWKSTNNGTNWTQQTSYFSNSDVIRRILMDPQGPSSKDSFFVVARRSGAPQDSVFRTADGGTNWSNVTQNLPATISDLRSDPNVNTLIYASTSTGIFKLSVPAAPTPSSPANGSTSVVACPSPTISWGSVTNALTYRLQISKSSSFSTNLVDVTQSGTSYAFSNDSCGTKYFWRVASINVWQGAWSSPIDSFTTGGLPTTIPALSSPANNATGITVCDPTVSWTADGCASSYQVQVASDTVTPVTIYDSVKTGTSDVIEPLLNCSQAYYWRVRSKNCNGAGTWSGYRKFTTACAEARQFSPSDGSTSISWCSSHIVWFAFYATSTKYQLQMDTTTLYNSSKLVDTTSPTTSINLPPSRLACNRTYYWRVRAQTCEGAGFWGPWSPTNFQFTTAACTPTVTLSYPFNGQDSLGFCPSAPKARWTSSSCSDSFRLQLATTSGFGATIIEDTASITLTECQLNVTLSAGQTYYWQVRGHSANGDGAWSSTFNFVAGSGATPGRPYPICNTLNVVTLWHVVPNASQYFVEVSRHANFDTIITSNTVTDSQWYPGGLLDNTKYYWHVKSSNCSGSSSFSDSCYFTTPTPLAGIGIVPEETPPAVVKPAAYLLEQNYPNPFNPTTTFRYALPNDAYVTLRIYDVLGREVAIIVDENQSAGYKTVDYDASALPSGIYFYRLTAGSYTNIKKMVLLR